MDCLSSHTLVVDTSVLLAVALREDDYHVLTPLLKSSPHLYVSAGTYIELFAVGYRRLGPQHIADLDELLGALRVEIVPVNEPQALLAREAYRRFGKGRHPAGLNFGDCFSYALATHLGQPLLFKGNDFSQTDVSVAHLA